MGEGGNEWDNEWERINEWDNEWDGEPKPITSYQLLIADRL